MQWAAKVVFGTVCDFVHCVWNISGTAKRIWPNSDGRRLWSLARTSLKVRVNFCKLRTVYFFGKNIFVLVYPMTVTSTYDLDLRTRLRQGGDEPTCQMSRSEVVSFESYCPNRHRHTHPTGCSTRTTRVARRQHHALRACAAFSLVKWLSKINVTWRIKATHLSWCFIKV